MSLRIMEVGRAPVQSMVKRHYLGAWPAVVVGILALVENTIPVGCCIFALPPRETAKRYGCQTWELARLFIEDRMPKNTESWFIARAIRWAFQRGVKCLVSYADPTASHTGTIYKASNWIFDGMTDGERFDYQVGGKRFSRRAHVPAGATVIRIPRTSKYRYVYWAENHESKRQQARGASRIDAARHAEAQAMSMTAGGCDTGTER